MSTRCQIGIYESKKAKIKDFESLLYQHCDGYPGTEDGKENGVLPNIMPFLKKFAKNRGLDDTEYLSARLIQHLCNQGDKEVKKYNKPVNQEFFLTSFGICRVFHYDIAYFYKISPECLQVYRPNNKWWDDPNEKHLTLIKTISLKF